MKTLWQDLRFGLRQLAAERGFSVAAILTLTLGIGATATIFTPWTQTSCRRAAHRSSTP